MKKRGINININIQKRHVWFLVGLIVLLIGVGVVIAFGGNQPDVMGHDIGELEGVQKPLTGSCTNEVLVGFDANGIVVCEPNTGDPTQPVKGSVIGGGFDYIDSSDYTVCRSQDVWGTAYCVASRVYGADLVACQSGSTRRKVSTRTYICIQD